MISSDFRAEARRRLSGKWGKAVCICLAFLLTSFVIGFIQGLLPEEGFLALVAYIAAVVIEVPIQFGLTFAFFKLYFGEDVKAFDFLGLGFKDGNFSRSWKVSFSIIKKMVLPIVLVVIAMIFLVFCVGGLVASSVTMGILDTYSSYNTNSLATTSSAFSGFSIFALIIAIVLMIVGYILTITRGYYYSMSNFIAFENPSMAPMDCVLRSKEIMTNNRGKLFCLQFSFIGWAFLAAFTFGIGMLWLLPYIQFATIAFYVALVTGNNSNQNGNQNGFNNVNIANNSGFNQEANNVNNFENPSNPDNFGPIR